MKIENLDAANLTAARIRNNQKAVKEINSWLGEYPNGNSNGKSSSKDKKLYSFCMGEYHDGSGHNINLSGSLVQTEVLKFTRDKLLVQIGADMKLMETY